MSGRLLGVGAACLLLVGASHLLSTLPLGGLAMPVALGLAAAKAFLIGWYFMELRTASTSIRVAVAVAILLFLILVGLAVVDVASRWVPPVAPPLGGAPPVADP